MTISMIELENKTPIGTRIKIGKLQRKLDKLIRTHRMKMQMRLSKKKNIRSLYKYVNLKLRENKPIGQLMVNGAAITKDVDKCNALAQHFKKIYNPRMDHARIPFGSRTESSLNYIDISPYKVHKCLSKLPLRPGTSPDSIPYYFLRKTADYLYAPLTRLFNNIQLQGTIPNIWKIGFVKPIFKKGSPDKVDNYRPICLTCCVSKVMERIICKEVKKYLTSNELLSPHQHGF